MTVELNDRVHQYMLQARPELWEQMSDEEHFALFDRINESIEDLTMNPPWPSPNTTDHLELVAYHQQVRTWATETALHQNLYEVWPIDPDSEEEPMEVIGEVMQLQQELRREREAFFERVEQI